MSRSHLRTIVPALLLALGLAACGADDPDTDQSPEEGATTASAEDTAADEAPAEDASATEEASPEEASAEEGAADDGAGSDDAPSVVSLSPTATELLFAIGAGDLVVAVDEFSTHPPEAPTTELSGFEPNVEAILEFDPDLVVVSFDPTDLVASLEATGVEVLVQPTALTLEDTYAQALELGEATGNTEGAEALVADVTTALEELADQSLGTGLTYYHEISPDLYSATSSTFVGEVYGLFGLENIADEAPDEFATGFPQLAAEYVIEADPDVVFLACVEVCGVTAASFAARDGFADLTAVTDGAVVELDDDVAGRWGPRVVEYAEDVRDALVALQDG